MTIDIEPQSGFCFGVENAIRLTEKALKSGEKIYCLGHIVHNEAEVKRLEGLGLTTINHDQFRNLRNRKVVIRAHGEPPETYRIAEQNNIEVIEATCPIVKSIQKRIADNYRKTGNKVQNLIFGKKEHAEVVGLLGQTEGNSILISNLGDINKIDFNLPSEIFSQTTKSRDKYAEVVENIRLGYDKAGQDGEKMLKVHDTICGQVANREPRLRDFCGKHDIIIFVSGKSSSNGKMLYNVCKSRNSNSYFVSNASELSPEWFGKTDAVGVCGATSTPRWLIREVAEMIEEFSKKNI